MALGCIMHAKYVFDLMYIHKRFRNHIVISVCVDICTHITICIIDQYFFLSYTFSYCYLFVIIIIYTFCMGNSFYNPNTYCMENSCCNPHTF